MMGFGFCVCRQSDEKHEQELSTMCDRTFLNTLEQMGGPLLTSRLDPCASTMEGE